MLTNHPTSIVVHGMALNITVQSYSGALDFGLMADAEAMPDVKAFAQAIEVSFDDLRALPLPHEMEAEAAQAQLGRALRSVRGAVSQTVSKTVQGAMTRAVGQVVRGAVQAAAKGAARKPAAAKPRLRRA